MKCPVCGQIVYEDGSSTTLVGYPDAVFADERGRHNHDDNCRIYQGHDRSGHLLSWRAQNSCPVCDWKGQEECFCSPLGIRVYDSARCPIGTYPGEDGKLVMPRRKANDSRIDS